MLADALFRKEGSMRRVSRPWFVIRVVLVALGLLAVSSSVALAEWPADTMHHAVPTTRIVGPTRFENSVRAARVAYPDWAGVDHVVIASGMDTALCNPLMASSLSWAYHAPMFLVGSRVVPSEVAQALSEIRSIHPTFTVTVVDSTSTVPPAVLAKIKASAGASATVEQPWPRLSRYSLSRAIAARVRAQAVATSRTVPSVVLIVNGVSSAGMLEGAPAAALAARTGIPVLVTHTSEVQASTLAAVAESNASERIVVGPPSAVSNTVASQLQATWRWSSDSLAHNSALIAARTRNRGWTVPDSVVFYSTLPDAVAGAQLSGPANGVSLFVRGTRLEKSTASFLSQIATTPAGAWMLGGTSTLPASLQREIGGAPAVPTIGGLHRYEGAKARVAGSVGSNTTKVVLYVNGVAKASRAVTPFRTYDFGLVSVPSGRSTWKVVASNPDGKTATSSLVRVDRLRFPYATCIIIDKSEFRLYWVKDNVLVKTYPVAIGRPGMETPTRLWRVGRKVQCDPRGVYGPRKMMLWKWTGSSWEFTNYAIHGTNEPWVIGTKASHGCIRMYNRDILELWPQVPLYTRVITRD
jgi:lipoprotein-anchoring transpeptidase ErfK/SrfK